jgi:hypothetical protein
MDRLFEMERKAEACKRWKQEEDPRFSMGICENLTCGYGKLD